MNQPVGFNRGLSDPSLQGSRFQGLQGSRFDTLCSQGWGYCTGRLPGTNWCFWVKFPASMPLTATAQASGADTLSGVGSTSEIRGAKQGLKNVQDGTMHSFSSFNYWRLLFCFQGQIKVSDFSFIVHVLTSCWEFPVSDNPQKWSS